MRNGINYDGIAQLTAVQAMGAQAVTAARGPALPPLPVDDGGLEINLVGALAGAAIGYAIARAASWPPIAGAAGGALLGGVLLG